MKKELTKQQRLEAENKAMFERLKELEEVRKWDDGPDKGRIYWTSCGDLVSGEKSEDQS